MKLNFSRVKFDVHSWRLRGPGLSEHGVRPLNFLPSRRPAYGTLELWNMLLNRAVGHAPGRLGGLDMACSFSSRDAKAS